MPTPRINGNPGKIRQSRKEKFDPTNGKTVIIEWAAPGGQRLEGYADDLKRIGIPYELNQGGPRSTLIETATDSVGTGEQEETVTQRFDFLYNESMQDIKEAPLWVALDPEQSTQILKDVDRYFDGKAGQAGGDWDDTDVWGADAITAQNFYNHMIQGVTGRTIEHPVLRHTYNIPGDTEQGRSGLYPASIDTNIGAVFTNAQLLELIPDRFVRIRQKVGMQSFPARSGFMVGWRKQPTAETTAANNRIEVTATYTFAQWSSLLYSAAS